MDYTEIEKIKEHLKHQDELSLEARAHRLSYLMEMVKAPPGTFGIFRGPMTYPCYEELRLAYINGLYLTTVLMSLAYVEHQLANQLCERGDSKVRDDPLNIILQKGHKSGMLSQLEFDAFDGLRGIANSYKHFRHSGEASNLLAKQLVQNAPGRDVIKSDAERAIMAFGSFQTRQVF